MRNHQYADLFPMMGEADINRLAEDIREKGQADPIIVFEDAILDGRNRFKACQMIGIEPRFAPYEGDDALGYVVSHNLHRRHLTESQRGMVAAKLATMKMGRPAETTSIDAVSKAEACEALNVGVSTLDRARKIQRLGAPELIEAVQSGEVTVGAAYKVAELPHEEQVQILSEGPKAVVEAAKKLKTPTLPKSNPPPDSIENTSEKAKTSPIKYIPEDGLMIQSTAQSVMDRILPKDIYFKEAMQKMADYCLNKISNTKTK